MVKSFLQFIYLIVGVIVILLEKIADRRDDVRSYFAQKISQDSFVHSSGNNIPSEKKHNHQDQNCRDATGIDKIEYLRNGFGGDGIHECLSGQGLAFALRNLVSNVIKCADSGKPAHERHHNNLDPRHDFWRDKSLLIRERHERQNEGHAQRDDLICLSIYAKDVLERLRNSQGEGNDRNISDFHVVSPLNMVIHLLYNNVDDYQVILRLCQKTICHET